MDKRVETFLEETAKSFHFLEQQHNYQQLEGYVKNAKYVKDMMVCRRYVGSQVGIEVWWYPTDAAIGVSFVELLQAHIFPGHAALSPRTHPDTARAIRLNDLVSTVDASISQNPDFLLKDLESSLPWKEKELLWKENLKIIQENMRGVLDGLARVTQTYASGILEGDISVFSTVIDYYVAKQKSLYPR